jgi:hypothetical protein
MLHVGAASDGTRVTRECPTLESLTPNRYADGLLVSAADMLSLPKTDALRGEVNRMLAHHPELGDLVYGTTVMDRQDVWLTYWMCYPRNDTPMTLGRGAHECDWERLCILVRDGAPVLAVGSQHRGAEQRAWKDVELEDGRPVVYPRWGTHAVAFQRGRKWLGGSMDIGNGRRLVDPMVEEITPVSHPWMEWPGRWGATPGYVVRGPLSSRTPMRLLATTAPLA